MSDLCSPAQQTKCDHQRDGTSNHDGDQNPGDQQRCNGGWISGDTDAFDFGHADHEDIAQSACNRNCKCGDGQNDRKRQQQYTQPKAGDERCARPRNCFRWLWLLTAFGHRHSAILQQCSGNPHPWTLRNLNWQAASEWQKLLTHATPVPLLGQCHPPVVASVLGTRVLFPSLPCFPWFNLF